MTSTEQAGGAGAAAIGAGETLRAAGHRMRELGVLTLSVRGTNGESHGVISQDMVVARIAAGGDPKTVTVGEVMSGTLPALLDDAWEERRPGPAWLWNGRSAQADAGPADAPAA